MFWFIAGTIGAVLSLLGIIAARRFAPRIGEEYDFSMYIEMPIDVSDGEYVDE